MCHPSSCSIKCLSLVLLCVAACPQLEQVGWQMSLQMGQSSQAKLKAPRAVLELGLQHEDTEVNTHNMQRVPLTSLFVYFYTCTAHTHRLS